MYFCWQPVPTLRILRLPAPFRHDFGGSFCYLNRFGFRSSSGRTSEGVAWGLPGGCLGVPGGLPGGSEGCIPRNPQPTPRKGSPNPLDGETEYRPVS